MLPIDWEMRSNTSRRDPAARNAPATLENEINFGSEILQLGIDFTRDCVSIDESGFHPAGKT